MRSGAKIISAPVSRDVNRGRGEITSGDEFLSKRTSQTLLKLYLPILRIHSFPTVAIFPLFLGSSLPLLSVTNGVIEGRHVRRLHLHKFL